MPIQKETKEKRNNVVLGQSTLIKSNGEEIREEFTISKVSRLPKDSRTPVLQYGVVELASLNELRTAAALGVDVEMVS
ncbi:hypothetical protein BGAL_1093g00010 [Botrytis galanthina]|uniref:Uncharacterized protein n=1 Tax=Botrytis galanthina TaxID=278940 RepID=A0A4S8QH07_9HELO|nr:hypothetical protein BGAL_1093g00010 [Botrytis galanthina]